MDMRYQGWSESLEFGLPSIDSQHRQLFDLAATFDGNGDQVRVMKTLVILSQYVRDHFREEEMLLEACRYPSLEAHREQHRKFRHMLVSLSGRAAHMTLDAIADEVRQLINGWFLNHILRTDRDYLPWVREAMAKRRVRD